VNILSKKNKQKPKRFSEERALEKEAKAVESEEEEGKEEFERENP
jgi:hypothetical protein